MTISFLARDKIVGVTVSLMYSTNLIEPGGYLHWVEVDPDASQTVKTVRSSSSTEATEELMDFLSKPRDSKGFG